MIQTIQSIHSDALFANEYNNPIVIPIVCLPPPSYQRATYTIIQNGYKCVGERADYSSDEDDEDDIFDDKADNADKIDANDENTINFVGGILSNVYMSFADLVKKWLTVTHRHTRITSGDEPLYCSYECRPREYAECSYATGLIYVKFEHKTNDTLNFIVCIRAFDHDT